MPVAAQIENPVVVEPIVSNEKLGQLLGLQAEYPELDFKRVIDLTSTEGVVELAKDVGAMQVRGGFIVGGVDDHGTPTGEMDDVDARPLDESRLVPMLRRYLPEPLEIRSRVIRRDGHAVALIYVGPHPSGCAVFHTDGQYRRGNQTVIRFRAGDVFWRDGTRSVRINQQGFEEIVRRRIEREKSDWLREHQELRRGEFEQLQAAYESRRIADAPLGALGLDIDTDTLISGALELLRRGDTIALEHLFREAVRRACDPRAGRLRDGAGGRRRQVVLPRCDVPRLRPAGVVQPSGCRSHRDLQPRHGTAGACSGLRDADRPRGEGAAVLAAGDAPCVRPRCSCGAAATVGRGAGADASRSRGQAPCRLYESAGAWLVDHDRPAIDPFFAALR